MIAEVIAIGDELTSGFRLDTNSQWLSQQLGDLGVKVMFHSTVGDDLEANVDVFRTAAKRADILVATGGLGPTADDLTRQAIADAACVDLMLDEDQVKRLVTFFAVRGREMPASNRIQAHFPQGAKVIPNPNGTAPGIEFQFTAQDRCSTVFALPGVPAEMKEMFDQTVKPKVMQVTGQTERIHHHVIRCFGAGESHIESVLPDIVKRGRDPLVGITASSGTISLRLTTKGPDTSACLAKMQPTIDTIYDCLGDLIFGENDDLLETVVAAQLKPTGQGVAIWDAGLFGVPASHLMKANAPIEQASAVSIAQPISEADLKSNAAKLLNTPSIGFGVAINFIDRSPAAIDTGQARVQIAIASAARDDVHFFDFQYLAHPAIREPIACKRVLNQLRLVI